VEAFFFKSGYSHVGLNGNRSYQQQIGKHIPNLTTVIPSTVSRNTNTRSH